MSRRLEAVGSFLIIKPDPIKEKSDGGIILAPTTQQNETDCQGTVFSCGTGWWQGEKWVDMPFKVGDRILFSPMGCQRIYYKVDEPTTETVTETVDGKEVSKEVKKGGVETFFVAQAHNIVAYVE